MHPNPFQITHLMVLLKLWRVPYKLPKYFSLSLKLSLHEKMSKFRLEGTSLVRPPAKSQKIKRSDWVAQLGP